MEVIVLHQQSLLDIAIQETGSAENAFAIALANNISITDVLTVGEKLIIPDVEQNSTVKRYFDKLKAESNFRPATAVTEISEAEEQLEGISYWIINQDFIVQ